MPLLTVDLCPAARELIQTGTAPIDGLELGPWFPLEKLRAARQEFPDLPFTYHWGDLLPRVWRVSRAIDDIKAAVEATQSPWVSLHIASLLPGTYYRYWRGMRPLPHHPERAFRRFVRQIARLKQAVDFPVVLENLAFPAPAFDHVNFDANAERISRAIEVTRCPLLVDTGHARVTATNSGLDTRDYLSRLPLDRVVQVHVSGPRMQDGRMVDAHQPLQEEDYRLLGWLLERTDPQIVTLEFVGERDAMREQMVRIKRVMGG